MADHTFLTSQGYEVVESGANWPDDFDEGIVYWKSSSNRYAIAVRDAVAGGGLRLMPLPKDDFQRTYTPEDIAAVHRTAGVAGCDLDAARCQL